MAKSDETFWNRLEDVNAGMLGLAGDRRPVPMSHYADEDEKALWFITADGTDLVKAASTGPKDADYLIASGGSGLYARLSGTLSLSTDQAKLDEIWNAVASAWFEDGKRDPDLRLLKFAIDDAEVWATKKSGVAFLYQVAKANLTGSKPDIGEHYSLSF